MEPDITERVFSGTLANLPELESTVVRVFLSSTFTDFQMERNWVMKHAVPILRKFCQERGLDFQTFLGDKYGFRPIPSEIEAAEFKLLKNMAMKLGHDTSLLLTWYKCDYNKEPTVYSLQPISSQFPHYFDMTPANATQRQNAQREWWSTVDKLTALLRQSATAVHKEGKLSEREKHKYFQSATMEKLIDFDLRESLSARHRTPLFEEVVHHLHFARSKCETFCGREDLIQKVREKAQEIFQVESGDGVEETNDDHDGVMDDFEEEQKQVKMEQDGLAASLAGMGTKYVAGDKFSDLESDPAFNPKVVQLKIQPHAEFCRPVIVVGKSGSGKTALMAKLAEVSQSWYASKNPVFMVRFLGTSTMSTAIREVLFGLCEQIWQVYKIQRPSGIDFDADYQYLTKYFAALLWKIDVMEKPLTIVLDSVDQLNQTDHAHMLNWLPQKLPKNVTFLISLVTDRTDCFRNLQQVFPFSERFIEMNKFQNDVASDVIIMMNKKYSRHLSKKQKNMILDQFAYCSQPLYLKLLVDMSLSWRSYTDVNQSLLGATIKEAINHLFDNLEKNHGEILVQRGIGYLCAAREGLSEMELEDLLSLDDEDTYIYHLPPDPEVIRLPPLLWKRIQYDIAEYVVERQSGGKKVIGWYHRQFSETARERYLHKGIRKMLHTSLAEYFQGIWSERCKPLQLIKGKKGNYPQNQRQVPAQPIKLSDHLYNTRKLSELSHHLVHSEQFETALNELFCDPDWLYAKCLTTTLTSLMEDLNIAQEACDQAIKRMKDEKEAFAKANGKEKEAKEVEDMIERNKKLLEGFRLVLSQLGPDYSGNPQVETLVQRCLTWCRSSPLPLMVPSRECVSKPDKRDPSRQCLYLREDLGQLYVVRQRSGGLSDQLCVFDLHDHGSCIAEETIGRYISGISFVGQNKYLLLDAYISSSGSQGVFSYDVKTEHLLFESSMAAPVGKAPDDHNGPYNAAAIFGKEALYYATCVWDKNDIVIFFAGYVGKPLDNAIVVNVLTGHNGHITDIVIPETLETIITASWDNTVKVWDLKTILENFTSELKKLEMVAVQTSLQLNGGDMMVELEDYVTKYLPANDEVKPQTTTLALNRSGESVYVGTESGKVQVYDIESAKPSLAIDTNIGAVMKMMLSRDGRFMIVAGSQDIHVVSSMFEIPIVVDLENEGGGSMIEPEKTDIMMTGAVSCAISPDDTLAAMSSTDGAVRIIDMSGNYLFRLQQKSSAVALVFSKDGASMLSAGYRTIYVWSIVDGSCKYKLARHLDFVNDMKFDETGQFLVTISRDKQVILWDFARAVSIATFQANCQVKAVDIATGGRCVAFIPEGIADLAILQPNKSLQDLLEGKVKQLNLGPQVEAMALTFTNQRKEKTGKASKSCVVM
ncbi:NWD1-like protein [Mya arenaria]|uniref:NWD1-like protein n=1 Tax=Mya arenaria TaxID=6604 RepID=A0ABY7FI75_MYAAR|nr:NWD1-like protein [Mya arenaria]